MKPSDDLKVNYSTDKNAESIADICRITGLSETTVRRHVKNMVRQGIWKEVIKKSGNVTFKAYIKIK